jgi:endogenous inhibitor of DNA gyrase (YacG/DUF329 family)
MPLLFRDSGVAPQRVPTMICPTCRIEFPPEASTALPFCSARCRQVDLGRWLDEKYSVPVVDNDDEEDRELAYDDEQ